MDFISEQLNEIRRLAFIDGDYDWCKKFREIMQEYKPEEIKDPNFPFVYEDVFWLLAPFYNYIKLKIEKAVEPLDITLISDAGEEFIFQTARYVYYAEKQLYHQNKSENEDFILAAVNTAVRHKISQELKTKGGYWKFAVQFPMCIRMCTLSLDIYLDSFLRMINNLKKDLSEITEYFKIKPPYQIALKPLSSDFHNKETGVYKVCINGFNIVYKSRNICSMSFLKSISETLDFCEKWIPDFIEKADYGYIEWIDSEFPETKTELNFYFTNWGRLLCLFYLFSSSDLVNENLKSGKSCPIWIDTETCIQPKFENDSELENNEPKKILRTDLFVFMEVQKSGALSKDIEKALETQKIDLNEICKAINMGFSEMWQKTVKSSLSIKKILYSEKFFDMPVRFLMRNTYVYQVLCSSFYKNEKLSDSEEYLKYIKQLYRAFPQSLKNIAETEEKFLLSGNMPLFTCKPHSLNLYAENQPILKLFYHTCAERIENQLKNMNVQSLEYAKHSIEEFIKTLFAYNKKQQKIKLISSSNIIKDEELKSKCENSIHKIAIEIKDRALKASDNSIIWTAPYKKLAFTDYSLFSGIIGIALFLALYGKYFNDSESKEMAETIYNKVSEKILETEKADNISFSSGISGILYGMCRIAEILSIKDKSALKKASRLIIDFPDIENQDFYQGNAGIIFALLNCCCLDKEAEKFILNKASDLCNSSKLDSDNFAHGNSGIAYSLISVYKYSGNLEYYDRALTLLSEINPEEYERQGICRGITGIAYTSSKIPIEMRTTEIKNIIDRAVSDITADNISLCCGESGVLLFLMKIGAVDKLKKHLSIIDYDKDDANLSLAFGKSGYGLILLLYISGYFNGKEFL